MATSRYLIYALVDPRTDECRYVGSSQSGLLRPGQHKSQAITGRGSKELNKWINALLRAGLSYRVKVLEELPYGVDLEAPKVKWIDILRSKGHNTLNKRLRAHLSVSGSKRVGGGDRSRLSLLKAIAAVQPCVLTSTELGLRVGVGERQIKRYLADLVAAGLVRSEVTHRRGKTQIIKERKLFVVESTTYGTSVQQN